MTKSTKIPVLTITLIVFTFSLVLCDQDTEINCTFADKSLCGWEQDKTDNFDWIFDCNNNSECRMYIQTTIPNKPNEAARLISPEVTATEHECFSFYYHMFGVRVNSLNIYLNTSDGQSTLIWHRKHSQDNLWRRGYRTIKSANQYKIIIEATAAPSVNSVNSDGIIAVKRLQLTRGICTPYIQQSDQACDFEEDFCMWNSDSKVKWKRATSLDIKLKAPKPYSDHTTETDNGYFAYIATDTTKTSISSTLLSKTLPETNEERCLQFYYYMRRGALAKLKVTVVFDDHQFKLLSSYTGVVRNGWTFAEVAIPGDKPHQILMEGIINNDANTILALDDVNVVDNLCEDSSLCGFEYGFCDWRNLIHDENDIGWLRSPGGESVVVKPNMPPFDLTGTDSDSLTGYFLFVDMSNVKQNKLATLSSKPIYSCPVNCFVFSYYTSGNNFGELQIIVNNYYGERILTTMSEVTDKWKKEVREINSGCVTKPFEIYIRAVSANGTGFIAIDGLSIIEGKCKKEMPETPSTFIIPTEEGSTETTSTITTTTITTSSKQPKTQSTLPLTKSHFTTEATKQTTNPTTLTLPYTPILKQNNCTTGTIDCGDGTCILAIFLCDGIKDCANNGDEANCELICQDKEMNSFCEGFNSPQCIPNNHLCDGNADCINEADETELLCGACPLNYCITGRCMVPYYRNLAPHCSCNDKEHAGRRCEQIKVSEPLTVPPTTSNYNIWVVIPMLSLLVVVIAILLVNLYCYRKYKWFHAAGLVGNRNRNFFYQRNSMTEMTTTNANVEEISDDVVAGAEAPLRRNDDRISMIHTPLSNYKLHRLYIGKIVMDDDGNIVAVSNA